MKFFSLFKKEIKDLITVQSLIGMFAGVLIFVFLGNMMSGIGDEMKDKMGSAVLSDQDKSTISQQAIKALEDAGITVHLIEGTEPADLVSQAFEHDKHTSVVVIPEGFGAGIETGKAQELQIISSLKSFSMMSNSDSSAQMVADTIKEAISTAVIQNATSTMDVEYIKNPVKTTDITVVGTKYEQMNSNALMSFAMQQSIFIPIIVFILITFASQLNAAAIANEKNDKTLETLLSAPVSRLSVLGAKMCASGVFSLIMAGVYMFGFSSYMSGMMGGMGEDLETSGISSALAALGLKLGPTQFLLIGVQLFLTLLIVLAISMILGALAKDLKSSQGLMMPLMFLTMIPYFITMLIDVNSLPVIGQILVNAIPFTHTFTAASNLLFGNITLFIFGVLYQIVVLAIVLFLAVKVFSTDRIFTMTLELKKKRKNPTA